MLVNGKIAIDAVAPFGSGLPALDLAAGAALPRLGG
jgi:hypothetical protein